MKENKIYGSGLKLHKLGFAVHWLHRKQKRPVEDKWTTGERKDWKYLKGTFHDGYNVGVRTGAPSKLENGYLACIDVDVKDPACEKAARSKLKEVIGLHKLSTFAQVSSGAGNGSLHLYCVTKSPFKMITVAKEKGWEICIYSDGRQMVLPPSVHPNGSIYKWVTPVATPLPLCDFERFKEIELDTKTAKATKHSGGTLEDFEVSEVELDWLPISDKVKNAIVDGVGVLDRSGYLLQATTALKSAGLTTNEILTVLTDPETFLGECAYDHAKTNSRKKAAAWLYKYTVEKVLTERSAKSVFAGKPLPGKKKLSSDELEKQTEDMDAEKDWKKEISRSGKDGMGPPHSTINNVVLILSNEVSPKLVRRNDFALKDTYSKKTPWGSKKNAVVEDDDIPRIIFWLGQHYRFEPSKDVIYSALTVMACNNSFDPVKDHLEALPAWDGTARIGTWLKKNFSATGPDEYLDQVFSKWLAAMIRRVYEPGAKFDWMPIFEGKQGTGKSSFGRLLVGDEYFLDWLPNLSDKDAALGLQGHWGVELGELSQFKRNELETIKAFVTRTVDKFRPPHGRKLLNSPRRCVFFGTTNKETYLIDDTGNRRFKPIKVGKLNFNALKKDRDQLFAEAIVLYKTKYNEDLHFELTGKAKVFEAEIHQEKMVQDESSVMFELMQDFIAKHGKNNLGFDPHKFRMFELFNGSEKTVTPPLARYLLNKQNEMFCGKMLKMFSGWKRGINGLNYWHITIRDTSGGTGVYLDFV